MSAAASNYKAQSHQRTFKTQPIDVAITKIISSYLSLTCILASFEL